MLKTVRESNELLALLDQHRGESRYTWKNIFQIAFL